MEYEYWLHFLAVVLAFGFGIWLERKDWTEYGKLTTHARVPKIVTAGAFYVVPEDEYVQLESDALSTRILRGEHNQSAAEYAESMKRAA